MVGLRFRNAIGGVLHVPRVTCGLAVRQQQAADAKPTTYAARTGDLDKKTAGESNFSKKSSASFSRCCRSALMDSLDMIGCSAGLSRSTCLKAWSYTFSTAAQSLTER